MRATGHITGNRLGMMFTFQIAFLDVPPGPGGSRAPFYFPECNIMGGDVDDYPADEVVNAFMLGRRPQSITHSQKFIAEPAFNFPGEFDLLLAQP